MGADCQGEPGESTVGFIIGLAKSQMEKKVGRRRASSQDRVKCV